MIIYDADITGSLKVNGSDFNLTSISSSIVTNSSSIASLELVSGSYANSASFASDISTNSASIASLEKVSGSYANSASFASSISANSSSIGSLNSVSGSYANSASFASNISANSASIGSLNAVSSSYLLNTTDTLTGDLTVTGNIIATTLNVQDVTASVVYSSGSNIFGSSSIDTQQFTGSILTSGSIEVNGDKFTVSGATGNTVIAGKVMLGSGTPVRKLELKTITGARNLGIGLNDKDGVEQATIAVDQNTNDLITATKSNMRFFTNSTIGSIATLPTNQALLLDTSLDATFSGNISLANLKSIYLGTSSALRIYTDSAVGYLKGNDVRLVNSSGNNIFRVNGDVAELYHNDSKKFETLSDGAKVHGIFYIDDYITHTGDGDTSIQFQADRQTYLAGGDEFIDFREATESYITLGNSNDTDTRMQGGAGYIFIQGSNGYIGINDSTPSYPFQVSANTVIEGTLETTGNSTFAGKVVVGKDSSNALEVFSSGDTEIGFSYATQGNIYAKIIGDITQASPLGGELAFQTATGGTLTERMRISASGNVGIGITPFAASLASQSVLDIGPGASVWGYQNYAYLIANAYYNSGWLYKNDAPAGVLQIEGNALTFRQAPSGTANAAVTYTQPFTINASGNVGIGITTPQTTLQVNGTASSFNAHFGQGTNAGSGVFGGISLGYSESSNSYYRKVGIVAKSIGDGAARQELHFLVDSVSDQNSAGIADSKMMIDINGNVGIGTTNPDQVGYGYKVLTIMGGATAGYAGVLELLTPTTDANGQNLGIISFGSGGTRNAMIGAVRQSGNNNGKLEFWTSAGASGIQKRMAIDADGQVGIGTDQPRTKFEIFRPAGQSSTPQLTLGTGENSSVDYSFSTDTISSGDLSILAGVSNTSTAIKMRFHGNDVFFGTPNSTYPSTNNFIHINTQSGVSMIVGGHSGTHTAIQFRHNGSTVCGNIVITSTSTSYNSGSSDKRLKKNITNWNENILDKFKDLQPKEFHFNNQDNTEKKQKGYIAQNEVDKFPEAYPLVEDEESGEKRYQFNPSGMNIYLMKAIQELEARIKILENK